MDPKDVLASTLFRAMDLCGSSKHLELAR